MAASPCSRCVELGHARSQGKQCAQGFEQHAWRSGMCRNCNHSRACEVHASSSSGDKSDSGTTTPVTGLVIAPLQATIGRVAKPATTSLASSASSPPPSAPVPVPVRSGSFASGLTSPRAQVTKASTASKHDVKASDAKHHAKQREEKEKTAKEKTEKEKGNNKQARSPTKPDAAAGETKDTKQHGKAATHDDAEADAKNKKSKKNDNSNNSKKKKDDKKDDKKESPRGKSNKKDAKDAKDGGKPETTPLNLRHLVAALKDDDEEGTPKALVATNDSDLKRVHSMPEDTASKVKKGGKLKDKKGGPKDDLRGGTVGRKSRRGGKVSKGQAKVTPSSERLSEQNSTEADERPSSPRRCLSDTDLKTRTENAEDGTITSELKDVTMNPSVKRGGRAGSPRPQVMAIIPEEGKVQVIVSPRAFPEVHEIKIESSGSGEAVTRSETEQTESGNNANSNSRRAKKVNLEAKVAPQHPASSPAGERRDSVTSGSGSKEMRRSRGDSDKMGKEEKKEVGTDGEKEEKGLHAVKEESDGKSSKKAEDDKQQQHRQNLPFPVKSIRTGHGSGIRRTLGPSRAGRSNSVDWASSSRIDSGELDTKIPAFDEAKGRKRERAQQGSGVKSPTGARNDQSHGSGGTYTASANYLRAEVDRLLGEAQEKEKSMIQYRSEITRLKLLNDQWKNEALALREEVRNYRENCQCGSTEKDGHQNGGTSFIHSPSSRTPLAGKVGSPTVPSSRPSSGSGSRSGSFTSSPPSSSLASPYSGDSKHNIVKSPAPPRPPNSSKPSSAVGRLVELRHVESEEREHRERRHSTSSKVDSSTSSPKSQRRTVEGARDAATPLSSASSSPPPTLSTSSSSSSSSPGSSSPSPSPSPVPARLADDIVISAPTPIHLVTFSSPTKDAVSRPPLTPPAPPSPDTPAPAVPHSNKKFQRLLKSAAKRMSSTEYRKSQSLKGGEVRLLQQMEMRENVVREILTTERNYKCCLSALIDEYQQPLKDAIAQHPDDWDISSDQVKTLFCQVEVVMSFTTVLLNKAVMRLTYDLLLQLEARLDGWNALTSTIGDIFVEMSAFMKVYRSYIVNYQPAHDLLKKLSKEDKKFAEFLDLANLRVNKQKQFFGYDMESFLITPVQRVPRYICLLRSLHQFTGPDHEDYELIGEAIKRVEAVAQENNKAHAANSNINKLLALQEMFNAQNINIVEPDRRYVHEGKAWIAQVVKGKVTKEEKPRYLLLFSDLAVVGKIRERRSRRATGHVTKDAAPMSPGAQPTTPDLTVMYQMDLLGMKIFTEKLELILNRNTDDLHVQNAFLLVTPDMTCFIYTATPQEKQKWVDVITKTLNEYREESKSRPLLAPRGTQRNSLFTKKRTSVGPAKAKTVSKASGGGMSGSPPADSSVLSAAHAKEDAKEEPAAEQDSCKSPRVIKEQDDVPSSSSETRGSGGDKPSSATPVVGTPEPSPSSSSSSSSSDSA